MADAVARGFAPDVAWAAAALRRQPTVAAVSVGIAVAAGVLQATSGLIHAVTFALLVWSVGWYGSERVFFQRQLEGKPVALSYLVRLMRFFVGRFFCLGVLFGIVLMTSSFALAHAFGVDVEHPPESMPIMFQLSFAALVIFLDFGLTFVTPALAYTTRSFVKALNIGLGMIAETWPRSALYVLCPPLALNLLNAVFPVGSAPVRLAVTVIVTLTGLVAKGAIAAFYLRERGSYGEDGAACRAPDGERAAVTLYPQRGAS